MSLLSLKNPKFKKQSNTEMLHNVVSRHVGEASFSETSFCSVPSSLPVSEQVANMPPSSITGVPSSINSLTVAPDWFSLSFPLDFEIKKIEYQLKRQFPLFKPVFLPFGAKGYTKSVKFGPARLLFGGSDTMPPHVELPGEAIRTCLDLFDFLSFAFESGASASRFDIACDDRGAGLLDIDSMIQCAESGGQVGSFRRFRPYKEFTSLCKMLSHSVYFGSRQSEVFARCYDKNLEQLQKKNNDFNLDIPWIRLEFELKGKNANQAFINYVSNGFKTLSGIFGGYCSRFLSFRIRKNDDLANRSRWPVASWWSSFLDLLPKVQTVVERAVSTLQKKAKWFSRSCVKTMSILLKSPDYGQKWLEPLVKDSLHRLTDQELALAMSTPF